MASHWPHADENRSATAQEREFARIWRDMPKLVYSRTVQRAEWSATILRKVVPEDIQQLKQQPGGDMVVGGANLAATFARYGLTDEYRIYLQLVVLGAGRPLFPPSETWLPLRLIDTHRFGNGVVLLNYAAA